VLGIEGGPLVSLAVATMFSPRSPARNVVGVAVVLPLIGKFTRFVERILPERGSPLTRCLDSSALATPIVAVEAVRRTVARALGALCGSLDATVATASRGGALIPGKDVIPSSLSEVTDALRQAQEFISGMNGPLGSKDDQQRLTSTLHALDHASRLAETAGEEGGFETASGGPGGVRAAKLCAEAMRNAALIAGEITAPASARGCTAAPDRELPEPHSARSTNAAPLAPDGEVIVQLEHCAKELDDLQRTSPSSTT
jgi:phosphate:Na+ symporter